MTTRKRAGNMKESRLELLEIGRSCREDRDVARQKQSPRRAHITPTRGVYHAAEVEEIS